jgi:hypothetical protein
MTETITAGPKFIRKFALKLLDDEHGINLDAYELLSVILIESGNEDILEHVDIVENKAYIGETYTEEELAKLEAEEAENE